MAKKVVASAHRLHQERAAGRVDSHEQVSFLSPGNAFEATLSRLSRGKIDASWWKNLLDSFGHKWIAPELFDRGELRAWVEDKEARENFTSLARARMLDEEEDPAVRSRLRRSYAGFTREPQENADDPIDVVVAILLAGFVADMSPGEQRVGMLVLQNGKETRGTIEQANEQILAKLEQRGSDALTVTAHTKEASTALKRLRQRRGLLKPGEAQQEARHLAERVQGGDLLHAEDSAKAEVFYWAARQHALQAETLDQARQFLNRLRRLKPDADIRVIDAWVLDSEGDTEKALRTLRSVDTPDARANFFVLLRKAKSPHAALGWLEALPNTKDPDTFTGQGWFNVAVALAKSDRWEEAADFLAATRQHRDECPDLAYLEGVVNAAMLLPLDLRKQALEMSIWYPGVQPLEGPTADHHRTQAAECFRCAKDLLASLHEDRAKASELWLLWLRLTSPDSDTREMAHREVHQAMREPAEAVNYVPIACAFNIHFDKEAVWGHLAQQSRWGGLQDREFAAQFWLAQATMSPVDFALFLPHLIHPQRESTHRLASKW